MANDSPEELAQEKLRAEIRKLQREAEALEQRQPFELRKVEAEATAAMKSFIRQLVVAFVGLVVPAGALVYTVISSINADAKKRDQQVAEAANNRRAEQARLDSEKALRQQEMFLKAFDHISHSDPATRAAAAVAMRAIAPPESENAQIAIAALVQRLGYEKELPVLESLAATLASYGPAAEKHVQEINQRAAFALSRKLGALVGFDTIGSAKKDAPKRRVNSFNSEREKALRLVDRFLVEEGLPGDWWAYASSRRPVLLISPELRIVRFGRYARIYEGAIREIHSSKGIGLSGADRKDLRTSIAQSARLVAGTSLAISSMINEAAQRKAAGQPIILNFGGIALTRGTLERIDIGGVVNLRDSTILVSLIETKLDSSDLSGSYVTSALARTSLRKANLKRALLTGLGFRLRNLTEAKSDGTCILDDDAKKSLPVFETTDLSGARFIRSDDDDDDEEEGDAQSMDRRICQCFRQEVVFDRCEGIAGK